MTKTATETNTIVEVNGLTIRKNALYKIVPKMDMTAPDGYQKLGTTKLPSEGIANTIGCRYVIQDHSTNQGVYDTGFYVGSPCYAGMDETARKERVKVLKANIIVPYEAMHGEGKLENKNTEFWDSFGVTLYDGRVFNTENEKDLLDLYIAVQGFELTPVGQEGSPSFNSSDYVVEDKLTSVTVDKKRTTAKFKAIGTFAALAEQSESKLINLLKYLEVIRTTVKPSIQDLQTYFELWINKDFQNADAFNTLYEKAETDEGYNAIVLQVKVKTMITAGKLTKLGGHFNYKGVELGVDSKSITANLLKNPELADICEEIMLT